MLSSIDPVRPVDCCFGTRSHFSSYYKTTTIQYLIRPCINDTHYGGFPEPFCGGCKGQFSGLYH
jgi:hypothetical protein